MTTTHADELVLPTGQKHYLEEQLEQLWLLTALQSGIDQARRGETVLADEAFFEAIQARLFKDAKEEVIEA